MWQYRNTDELYHHGILGMKWGVRRYQNKDGSYTSAGKKRYISDKTKYLQRDIDSFKPYSETGIKTKKGKTLYSAKEVNDIVRSLENVKSKTASKYAKKWDNNRNVKNYKSTSQDAREANLLKRKKINQLTNAELRILNNRQQLERTYKLNNKTKAAAGVAAVGTALVVLNKLGNIDDSLGKLQRLTKRGKSIYDKLKK